MAFANWEAPGHSLRQIGERYIAGFNANSSGSSASVIQAANVSAYAYVVGVPTSNYITPQMCSAGEIYGVIPVGGSKDYDPHAVLTNTVQAGRGYVYTSGATGSANQVKRQIFRIANQVGDRHTVSMSASNAAAVGNRVVLGGAGVVKAAASVASNATVAAGQVYSNWVCVLTDTTNSLCVIEKVG